MEYLFLIILFGLMAFALGSGYPVAFALPGSAIITIAMAGLFGFIFEQDTSAFFVQGGPLNWLTAGITNFRGIYWEVERDTLIAIPLFIFMGIMLQRSRIAEDLLITMAQLFGTVRGGLGISVVFVGALLAATTGIVGATVVAMGLISLPAMLKNNYSHGLATGTIAASGTLGQIIPPSIVLIILADQLSSAVDIADMARKKMYKEATGNVTMPSEFGVNSTSAGDMFMGALLPGLVLVGLYMLYILVAAYIKRDLAPAVPLKGKRDKDFMIKVLLALIPPLTLIFIVLGSIIGGIATVNQAGAIGAIGALIMAGYRLTSGQKTCFYPSIIAIASIIFIGVVTTIYTVNIRSIQTPSDVMGVILALIGTLGLLIAIFWSAWRVFKIDDTLNGVMLETAKTTSLVFIILLGATMLTAAFRGFGGEEVVKDFLVGMPGGFWSQFIIVMIVIFVLGFFLDFIEIAVVVVPIVAPILLMDPGANISAVWLGVMIGLNIQTSFLTPPFGFALFYLRGVASKAVSTISMYKGVIPFISLQIFALIIVGYAETIVNYLPTRLSLLGNSAPPPVNPKLQSCMEDYVHNRLKIISPQINSLSENIRNLDSSFMSKKTQNKLTKSLQNINNASLLLPAVYETNEKVNLLAVTYKPIRDDVRFVELKIDKAKNEIKELKSLLQTLDKNTDSKKYEKVSSKIKEEEVLIKNLISEKPSNWNETYKKFNTVLKEEASLKMKYRRSADKGYEDLRDFVLDIEDVAKLQLLKNQFVSLSNLNVETQTEEALPLVQEIQEELKSINGTYNITESLSKLKKELERKTQKIDRIENNLKKSLSAFDLETSWREKAKETHLASLSSLEVLIRGNIGLRRQPQIPEEQAKEILYCQTFHKDLSLYF
ncbi:MAG: TRAP transporter large permease subunit [Alphaproteobacteria bacterium]|jgi:tripartite ATP-independent transporter DctM subunit|nr:TRAP transporter large permease subunit [Alphaproteobacteria bacterium]